MVCLGMKTMVSFGMISYHLNFFTLQIHDLKGKINWDNVGINFENYSNKITAPLTKKMLLCFYSVACNGLRCLLIKRFCHFIFWIKVILKI